MLSILIDSGIDETDSKAIIFDIIQIQGAESTERKKLIEVRREREKIRKRPPTFKTQQYEEEREDEEGSEEERSEKRSVSKRSDEVEVEGTPPKRRHKRRVNFSDFGGNAEPIK